MPWPAHRAFIANHDHVTFNDVPPQNAKEGFFFTFINFRGSFKVQSFFTGNFTDRRSGGEVPAQDSKVRAVFDGLIPRADNILFVRIGAVGRLICKGFRNGFACYGEAVPMEQAAVEQTFSSWDESRQCE
jgi:hypothetical protein